MLERDCECQYNARNIKYDDSTGKVESYIKKNQNGNPLEHNVQNAIDILFSLYLSSEIGSLNDRVNNLITQVNEADLEKKETRLSTIEKIVYGYEDDELIEHPEENLNSLNDSGGVISLLLKIYRDLYEKEWEESNTTFNELEKIINDQKEIIKDLTSLKTDISNTVSKEETDYYMRLNINSTYKKFPEIRVLSRELYEKIPKKDNVIYMISDRESLQYAYARSGLIFSEPPSTEIEDENTIILDPTYFFTTSSGIPNSFTKEQMESIMSAFNSSQNYSVDEIITAFKNRYNSISNLNTTFLEFFLNNGTSNDMELMREFFLNETNYNSPINNGVYTLDSEIKNKWKDYIISLDPFGYYQCPVLTREVYDSNSSVRRLMWDIIPNSSIVTSILGLSTLRGANELYEIIDGEKIYTNAARSLAEVSVPSANDFKTMYGTISDEKAEQYHDQAVDKLLKYWSNSPELNAAFASEMLTLAAKSGAGEIEVSNDLKPYQIWYLYRNGALGSCTIL